MSDNAASSRPESISEKLDRNTAAVNTLTRVIRWRTRLVVAALIFDAVFTTTLGVLYARQNVQQTDFRAERHRQNIVQCESGNKARHSIIAAIDGLLSVAIVPRPGETPAEIAQSKAFQVSVDARLRSDLPTVDCSKVP